MYAFGDVSTSARRRRTNTPAFLLSASTSQSDTSFQAVATAGDLLAVPFVPPNPAAPTAFSPNPQVSENIVGVATRGFWIATADGGVYSRQPPHEPYYGDARNVALRAPIVGIAMTLDLGGYYLAGKDGGVFTYGDAVFAGAPAGLHLAAPIVGIAAS